MRIALNLATRPFVELRPLFARLRLAMAALALLAVGLAIGAHLLGRRAALAQAQMDALKAKTLAIENERQANERRMTQPANRAVLERSKFLNGVFARKSFSWTSVMMDLERVLPAGVQVTSIEPAITPAGDVTIRLRVVGERDRAVDLVRNLERSQRFLYPRLSNETAQTQEAGRTAPVAAFANVPGGVEFDILSQYNPLPAKQAGFPKKATSPEKTALGPHNPASGKPPTGPTPLAQPQPAPRQAPGTGGTR